MCRCNNSCVTIEQMLSSAGRALRVNMYRRKGLLFLLGLFKIQCVNHGQIYGPYIGKSLTYCLYIHRSIYSWASKNTRIPEKCYTLDLLKTPDWLNVPMWTTSLNLVQCRCFQNMLRRSSGCVFFPCGPTEHATLCSDATYLKLSAVNVYPAEPEPGRPAARDSTAGLRPLSWPSIISCIHLKHLNAVWCGPFVKASCMIFVYLLDCEREKSRRSISI